MVSRLRLQYCKVIIATSLVWFLLDVLLLMYYTDCTAMSSCADSSGNAGGPGATGVPGERAGQHGRHGRTPAPSKGGGGGLFDKLIPNGE